MNMGLYDEAEQGLTGEENSPYSAYGTIAFSAPTDTLGEYVLAAPFGWVCEV